MKSIDLVFRSCGERTADAAFELARKNIRPDSIHLIDGIRPFTKAVRSMMKIEHNCDFVVYVDADCLILEDLRAFLEFNPWIFVDCRVRDFYRGYTEAGVHILRKDLVCEMQRNVDALKSRFKSNLRPESSLRNLAMRIMEEKKQVKSFNILHDYFQRYQDIFTKYVIRELRSRKPIDHCNLDRCAETWDDRPEYEIARTAIRYARTQFPGRISQSDLSALIERLPSISNQYVNSLNLEKQELVEWHEIEAAGKNSSVIEGFSSGRKVFGIGLNHTGSSSLSTALCCIGIDALYCPIYDDLLMELKEDRPEFSVLDYCDGIAGIIVSSYFRELDTKYPGSKFILTIRDEQQWIASVLKSRRSKKLEQVLFGHECNMQNVIWDVLSERIYGSKEPDSGTLLDTFRYHNDSVQQFFKNRPDDLLVVNLTRGDGWDEICSFLGVEVPPLVFPHVARHKSLARRRVARSMIWLNQLRI